MCNKKSFLKLLKEVKELRQTGCIALLIAGLTLISVYLEFLNGLENFCFNSFVTGFGFGVFIFFSLLFFAMYRVEKDFDKYIS